MVWGVPRSSQGPVAVAQWHWPPGKYLMWGLLALGAIVLNVTVVAGFAGSPDGGRLTGTPARLVWVAGALMWSSSIVYWRAGPREGHFHETTRYGPRLVSARGRHAAAPLFVLAMGVLLSAAALAYTRSGIAQTALLALFIAGFVSLAAGVIVSLLVGKRPEAAAAHEPRSTDFVSHAPVAAQEPADTVAEQTPARTGSHVATGVIIAGIAALFVACVTFSFVEALSMPFIAPLVAGGVLLNIGVMLARQEAGTKEWTVFGDRRLLLFYGLPGMLIPVLGVSGFVPESDWQVRLAAAVPLVFFMASAFGFWRVDRSRRHHVDMRREVAIGAVFLLLVAAGGAVAATAPPDPHLGEYRCTVGANEQVSLGEESKDWSLALVRAPTENTVRVEADAPPTASRLVLTFDWTGASGSIDVEVYLDDEISARETVQNGAELDMGRRGNITHVAIDLSFAVGDGQHDGTISFNWTAEDRVEYQGYVPSGEDCSEEFLDEVYRERI